MALWSWHIKLINTWRNVFWGLEHGHLWWGGGIILVTTITTVLIRFLQRSRTNRTCLYRELDSCDCGSWQVWDLQHGLETQKRNDAVVLVLAESPFLGEDQSFSLGIQFSSGLNEPHLHYGAQLLYSKPMDLNVNFTENYTTASRIIFKTYLYSRP